MTNALLLTHLVARRRAGRRTRRRAEGPAVASDRCHAVPVRPRDRPLGHAPPDRRRGRGPGPDRGRDRALRPVKAKVSLEAIERLEAGQPARQVHPRHGDHARRRSARARPRRPSGWRRASTGSAIGPRCHPPALARAGLRDQGRRRRRRLQPGHPDGGLQPPPHRRRPRDRRGAQPGGRVHRQQPPPRQPARDRPVLDPLATGRRHQRPGDPQDGHRPRRARERRAPRDRVGDHGRVARSWRSSPWPGTCRTCARGSAGSCSPRRPTASRSRPRTSRSPGAMTVLLVDAIKPNLLQTLEGGPAFVHCGPVRQHRPRQQLHPRRPARAGDERDRLHRGGLRRRHGRREVLRHQVPRVGPAAGRGGHRGHDPRAQDARRRGQDRRRQAARPGARRGERRGGPARRRQPGRADRDRPRLRRPGGRGDQRLPDRHRRPRSRRSARSPWRPAPGTPSCRPTGPTAARGAEALAQAVWAAAEEGAPDFQLLYPDEAPLRDKIEAIATRVYGAARRRVPAGRRQARSSCTRSSGFGHLPICMAKTQYSLSHDASLKGRPTGFRLPIREVRLSAGAGFVTPLLRRDADDAGAAVTARRREHRHRRRREHRRPVLRGWAAIRRASRRRPG